MSFLNKHVWISIPILIITYSLFGWLVSWNLSYFSFLLNALLILVICLGLTAPLTNLKKGVNRGLKSDTRAYIIVILSAFAAVVIMHWFEVFVRLLVIVSASALARLDLDTLHYNQRQAFWILILLSLAGFMLGVILNLLYLSR